MASIDCSDIFEYPPVKGVVRGAIVFGGFILEKVDDKTTKVIYLSSADLNGSIPQMIVNLVQKGQGAIAGRIDSKMNKDKSK